MIPTNVTPLLATGLYLLAVYHGTMFIVTTVGCHALRIRPGIALSAHRLLIDRRMSFLIGGVHLVLSVLSAWTAWLTMNYPSLPILGCAVLLVAITALELLHHNSQVRRARRLRVAGAATAAFLAIIPIQLLATAASVTLF